MVGITRNPETGWVRNREGVAPKTMKLRLGKTPRTTPRLH